MEELTQLFEGFCVNLNLLWYAMGALMVCDFVTGIAKAYRREKCVSSAKLRDGGMIAVSLLCVGISRLFNDNGYVIANSAVAYYVYTELVSIVENLIALDVPLPPIVKRVLGGIKKA